MMRTRILLFIALIAINFATLLHGEQQLTTKEVPSIMQQIFDQHVSQKEMTPQTLKNSYMVYINQFDPHRIYLLESEVLPFEQLSNTTASQALQDYKNEKFPSYVALNTLIQKAIFRARVLRKGIGSNSGPLFFMVGAENGENSDVKRVFAKTTKELQDRIRTQLVNFINEEKYKFGTPVVMQNQPQILALFEKYAHDKENQYLYLDDSGKSITPAAAENLFAFHMLKAFTSSLDAHTSFFNASEANDLKMKLQKKFEGIGISVEERPDGKMQITEIAKGSPANISQQIEPKDILLSIDGQELKEKTLDEVMDALQNGSNKDVRLVLERNGGKPFEITLQRTAMTIQEDRVKTAFHKVDGGIIGVITLYSFYQGENDITSENDIKDAIRKLQAKGPLKGLILDLRDNSGGFLMQAVKTAGLFMTNGVVVISKYFNGDEHFYRDLDGTKFYDGPLIVLTSRATASAAEIVAQALQDYGIALIVGDKETYGKGTIQNQTVTKDNTASLFKVTVGRYYTVSGKTPQLNGVKADIVVPGAYNYEKIGEKFLTATIPADTIPPDYNDTLDDLTLLQKQWFALHYLPTLQQKQTRWNIVLNQLRLRSAQRIAQNADYQNFIRHLQKVTPGDPTPMNRDYQLIEAVNILNDMIAVQPSQQILEPISENVKTFEK